MNDNEKESISEKLKNVKLPENYKETEEYKNWLRFEYSCKNYYPFEENVFLYKKITCKTYIKKSNIENAGYGVFASEKISAGDLIEEAPFIVLETTHKKNTDSKLKAYSYSYYHFSNEKDANMLIPFGNFLCYNHSIQPNAYYTQDDQFKLLRMYAYKDIEKDEEITWYYSPGYSHYIRYLNYQNELDKDFPFKNQQENEQET